MIQLFILLALSVSTDGLRSELAAVDADTIQADIVLVIDRPLGRYVTQGRLWYEWPNRIRIVTRRMVFQGCKAIDAGCDGERCWVWDFESGRMSVHKIGELWDAGLSVLPGTRWRRGVPIEGRLRLNRDRATATWRLERVEIDKPIPSRVWMMPRR